MQEVQISKDISTFYVQADHFPMGVGGAYQRLHALLPSVTGRRFFGISFAGGPDGSIIYRAAVEETRPGEGEGLGCPVFIIPAGTYISETLPDWKKDETSIGKTFQQLLADPRIDQNGFCLEIYLNEKDVQCLVGINQ